MNMQAGGAAGGAGGEAGGRGRAARLARLRRLVAGRRAHSQEQLLRLLEQEGFEVTQATLSRDLKQLRVGKLPDGQGGYLYALPESGASESSLIEDFRRGFLSIEFSGNQGVIRTLPGHANSVAFALDNLRVPGVLGTIAGDDTILVIPRDGVRRSALAAALRARIPGLQEDWA